MDKKVIRRIVLCVIGVIFALAAVKNSIATYQFYDFTHKMSISLLYLLGVIYCFVYAMGCFTRNRSIMLAGIMLNIAYVILFIINGIAITAVNHNKVTQEDMLNMFYYIVAPFVLITLAACLRKANKRSNYQTVVQVIALSLVRIFLRQAKKLTVAFVINLLLDPLLLLCLAVGVGFKDDPEDMNSPEELL